MFMTHRDVNQISHLTENVKGHIRLKLVGVIIYCALKFYFPFAERKHNIRLRI